MNRKAVLIFADPTGLDLARRRLPRFLRPLFSWRRLQHTRIDADLHLFSSRQLEELPGVRCHLQHGATFAERLEAAAAKVTGLGYTQIVIVGSDCPTLTPDDVAAAFSALKTKRLVLGPDHRGGCYLIGFRAADRRVLEGVRWNRNADYLQLLNRLAAREVASLSVKQDLDSWADLHLLARAGNQLARLAEGWHTFVDSSHDLFVDLMAQAQRVRGQMPPPAIAI